MPFSCERLSRGINLCSKGINLCSKGINLRLGALTPVPPLGFTRVSGKERDQKLYLQPTCTTQDVVTSMSGSAMKRAAERPPVTAKGYLKKKKTVPRVGALCRSSVGAFAVPRVGALCPLCALGVPMPQGSNVPVLRLGVPMSRGSNVKPGCVA